MSYMARMSEDLRLLKAVFLIVTMVSTASAAVAAVDANFTFLPANPVANQTIQFTDTSTGGPTNWQWDFNDDGTTDSTAQNPSFSYSLPGTYQVTLVAFIPPADLDSITRTVVVSPSGDPGDLSFTQSSYTVNESAGMASIPVRRTGGSSGTVTAVCNTSNGSATAGSDYTATSDLLTWGNNDTSNKFCTIPINNDSVDEANETINLSLRSFTGGADPGTPSSATLTIIDDDPPPSSGNLSFTMSNYSVNENAGSISIPVRRTGGSSGTVSVRCSTSNGTAAAGMDYTATSVTLTWGNNDSANKFCQVPITNDSQDEPDETVNLSLTNFTGGAGMGTPTSGTLTIIDDDPPPGNAGNLSFTTSNYTINENAGTASVPVRRTDGSTGMVSVVCSTSNGSAMAGMDYTAQNDTLTWNNGDSSNKLCTIPITNDSQDEPNETINLSLSNFSGGAGMGTPTTATLTIIDDDPPPTDNGQLSFTLSSYTVNENVGVASINVRRTGGSDGLVSVRCQTSDGTATVGTDYTATNDLLSWPDGDSSNKMCTVPIDNDSAEEDSETINLSLANFLGGATPGTPSSAVLTITDDDESGQLQFSAASYVVDEDVGVAEVIVRRVGGSDGFISVRCNASNGTATSPDDYGLTSDLLSWSDGDTGVEVCTIPIVDDLIQEGNETVLLSLDNFQGGADPGSPTNATLTITANDDFGDVSFSAASYTFNENVGTASIAVTRTGGSDNAISVRCDTSDGSANAPDDYGVTMDVLNWAAGDTANKTCTVPIVNDSNDEPTETVNLTLTNFSPGGVGMGANTEATLNITDNDEGGDLGFVMSTYTVNEGVGTASIAVRRTGGSDGPVSVRCDTSNGTATAPGDYTTTMDVLNWADGDTANKTCTVPIVDDVNDEPQETVQLSLSNFTGGAGMGSPATAILEIDDNDEAGDLRFSMATYEVDEEDDLVAMIAVSREGGSDGPVSVQCNTSNGTATAGADYEATADVLNWSNGDTADKICTVPILDDNIQEAEETINLSMSNFTGGASPGSPSAAVLTILESENPGELSFTTTTYSVSEGDGVANITVKRTNGANGAVSVRCEASDGTANQPDDYGVTADVLTWSDGDTANKTCTVPVVDDSLDEAPETVVLNLVNFTDGVRQGEFTGGILTINDNDEAGQLSFSTNSYSVDESVGTASIAVRRIGGTDGAVSVRCDSANGTATAPADYGATADVLTWTDGDSANKICTVPVVDDTAEEGDETVNLSLSNVTGGASLGAPNTATLTLVDNDDHGQLSFSMPTYSVNEGDGVASITVQRTGGSDGAVSVRCESSDGSASAPGDYAATSDLLSWADGDTADKICTVPIVDDPVSGPDETVNLSLTNVTGGATLGTPSMVVLTIVDNDVAGQLALSMASYSVDEGAGTATITVTRTGGTDGPVSVGCNTADGTATSPDDYGATMETLSWADGDSASKTCSIPIVNDSSEESDETVDLSLSGVTGGAIIGSPSVAALTIVDDDDHGELAFSMSTYSVNEGDGVASIAVQRTGGSDGAVSVRCDTADGTASAPGDYAATSDVLSWADGDTADKTCTVPIVDDPISGPDETIDLSLSNATGGATLGAPNAAVLTIVDDDNAGVIVFAMATYSVNEDDETASIEVARTGGSDGPVSVQCNTADGTATAPGDYTATTDTLEWADGETANKTCTIPIEDDSIEETDETVSLSLSNITGGATFGVQTGATLNILDQDDAGQISFSTSDYSVGEADGTAPITVQRFGGSGGAVSVDCATTDGSALAPNDYTATMTTLNWGDGDTADKICSVPIADDSSEEGAETVGLSLSNATGGADLGSPNAATLTITDNDTAGVLSFSADSYSVDEADVASISVQRTGGSGGAVSVICETTASGTATPGTDFTVTSEVLNWGDGDIADKVCSVTTLEDMDDDFGETVALALSGALGGVSLGTPNTATLTIIDNENSGELTFSESSYTFSEDVGSAAITVQRLGGSGGPVSVRCDTSNGIATEPDDYTATMDVLAWGDGETVDKTCLVPIVDDSLVESPETVALSLTNFVNASMGSVTNATLTITDDDAAGELGFSMDSYKVDEGSAALITVQRSGGSDGVVSVDCIPSDGSATAPTDYGVVIDTLTWADGETADQTCTVTTFDDGDDEGGETVALTLSNASVGTILGSAMATLTIVDDENSGELTFSMASYTVNEDVGIASITVQRLGGSDEAASVDCTASDGTATTPGDYGSTTVTLSWPDGNTMDQTCSVPIVDDSEVEGDETVDLTLTSFVNAVGGSTTSAVLTITDNETPGVLGFSTDSYTVDETAGTAVIAVQRTGGSDGAASVRCMTSNGTASSGMDYGLTNDLLTWAAGDATDKDCTVPISLDDEDEGNETVNLSLASFVGAGEGSTTAAVLTILDVFAAGELSFSMASYEVNEGNGTASIAVQRTGGSDGAVSVDCESLGSGTATAGSDYTATSDTLNWASGDTADQHCTVPIVDDAIDESAETVDLELTNPTGSADLGLSNATLTITDNETSQLSFTAAGFTVDESVGVASITVQRTGGSNGAVSVQCNAGTGGTATAGTDYLATAQVLNWGDGVMGNQTCSVPIVDDAASELDETVSLMLSDVTGDAELGTPSTSTLTLIDDDSPGTIQFSMVSYSANEGSGTASVTVQRADGSDGAVSVRCDSADGTATAPDDYTATMDVLTWADGNSDDQTCTIPILDDVDQEGGETVLLSLSLVTGDAVLGTPSAATLNLVDNDDAGELSFTSTSYGADESDGVASITVRRTGGSDGAVSVECQTVAGGSATAGDDFLDTIQALQWGDGDTADKICTVPIIDDATEEGDETVSMALANPTGNASVGTPGSATLTLNDDDSPGVFTFSMSTYKVDEAAGTASVIVQRTAGSDGAVSVRCDTSDGTATAPDDYGITMDVLTWADGDTADRTCTVPIVDDTDEEGSETVALSLSNETGGATLGAPNTATLTINDNDVAGTLRFSTTAYTVDEGAGSASITVSRDGDPTNAVSVQCNTADGTATAGADYLATSQTVSWGAGDVQNKTCTVPILEDGAAESNETVALSLSGPTGGATLGSPSTATLTINDNDNVGSFAFTMASYTVDEATGTLNVIVQRNGGTQGAVSVRCDTADGTAEAPGDYAAQMTLLTWADGEGANKTCSIPIVDDTLPEGNETFDLQLTLPTGGAVLGSPNSATVTIQGSDDPGTLSFTSTTYRVGEGGSVASIRVRRTDGANGAASVRCNTSNGTATAGSDYTVTSDLLSWTDGDGADKFCTVPILDNDGAVEGNETVNLTLTNFTGAGEGSPINATLTIEEDLFSDGFESGDTGGWSNASGALKMGGVRILADKNAVCGLATAGPGMESIAGVIRLRTVSEEPFILTLATLEGEFVADVKAGAGQVVEVFGLALDAYEVGVVAQAKTLKLWIVDLDAATPCAEIDLASDGQ